MYIVIAVQYHERYTRSKTDDLYYVSHSSYMHLRIRKTIETDIAYILVGKQQTTSVEYSQ